jgi:hypothetical protein
LVAEGPTDDEVINAALKAIVPDRFTLTLLHPEPTQPAMGCSWGGVLKWCDAAGVRHADTLDGDPTLEVFDLLVIHLDVDVDVAQAQCADCGLQVPAQAALKEWAALPCDIPCPPTAQRIRKAVREYRTHAGQVTAHWGRVKEHCRQAAAFEQAVKTAL